MMDLSSLDSLSSMDMTTQLAMMVMMMTQSKGGQLTSHVIIFLTGLVGVNRKSEVGPRSSGSSFFFFLIPAQSCLLLSDGAAQNKYFCAPTSIKSSSLLAVTKSDDSHFRKTPDEDNTRAFAIKQNLINLLSAFSRLKALKSPFGPYHHMTTWFTVRSYDHSPSPWPPASQQPPPWLTSCLTEPCCYIPSPPTSLKLLEHFSILSNIQYVCKLFSFCSSLKDCSMSRSHKLIEVKTAKLDVSCTRSPLFSGTS